MSEVLKQGMNIGFKCGLQSALAPYIAGTSVATDGVFYLTTDTNRLYVGSNGKAVPVNQGIQTVATSTALASMPGEQGQFYYITEGNVLAVRSGDQWIQINPDTGIAEFRTSLATTADGIKVTNAVYDTNSQAKSESFDIAVDNGLSLSIDEANTTGASTAKFTISGDTSTLSAAANGTKAKVSLGSTGGSASGDVNFSVTESGSTESGIAVTDGEVAITVRDTHNTGVEISNETNGFKVKVTDSRGEGGVEGTFNPTIKLGDNEAGVSFENGVATLDVYSKSEISGLLQALNAMTYKGTVGATGTAGTGVSVNSSKVITGIAGVTSYAIGDTFLLVEDSTFKASATAEEKVHQKYSLIIAKGTETDGAITSGLSFDVVEASNNTDTTYKLQEVTESAAGDYDAGYGVKLTPSTGDGAVGSLIVKGKNYADGASVAVEKVSSAAEGGGVKEVLAVSHDKVTRADVTDTTGVTFNKNTTSATIVSEVDTDSTGHITSVKTKTITIGVENIDKSEFTTSASGNTGTVSHNIILKDREGETISDKTGSFTIESDSLTITNKTGNSGLKMEMLWGSF